MTSTLSKAKRLSIAGDVVRALQSTVDRIADHLQTAARPFFANTPTAIINPDGSFKFHIPSMASSWNPLSRHEEISSMGLFKEFEEAFAPAAKGLSRLLPGQHLKWSVNDDTKPARHILALGQQHKDQPVVIETALSRWKTPLARLSSYLEDMDGDVERFYSFHLHIYPEGPDDLNHHETEMMRVDARNIAEAIRLSGFEHASGAAPMPRSFERRFATCLGASYTPQDYASEMKERMEATAETREAALTAASGSVKGCQQSLRQLLEKAMVAMDISIEADILGKTNTLVMSPSPYAARVDIDTAHNMRPDIAKALENLVSSMNAALAEIHPHAYEARMRITAQCQRSDYPPRIEARVIIDNLPMSVNMFALENVMQKAGQLACVTQDGPHRFYVLQPQDEAKLHLVLKREKTRHVCATSPAHAALILAYNFTETAVIREVKPVPLDDILEAERSAERARDAYKP